MDISLIAARYDPWVVSLSNLIATFASYVALDLAERVRTPDGLMALTWWVGGSLAMGTGIWSMHFVGMLAVTLPIEVGYAYAVTAMSWVTAVLASGVALYIASRERPSSLTLVVGALSMGLGVCAMHYIGMAALEMSPTIRWNPWLIATSAAVAIVASAAALMIFAWLRRAAGNVGWRVRTAAALAMGAAVCGMHYTGMAGRPSLRGPSA